MKKTALNNDLKKAKEGCSNSIPVRSTKKSLAQQGFSSLKEKSRAESRANLSNILLNEFFEKSKKMTSLPYKPAKLYFAKGDLTKEWYVEFFFLQPGTIDKYKRFKERFDINRIKTYKERYDYGKELEKFLNEKLKSGFNPFTAVKRQDDGDFKISAQLLKVTNQLGKNASKVTQASYRCMYNRLVKFLEEKKLTYLYISLFTLEHARTYKQWALHERNLSVKTVNDSISHLGMFWDEAIEMGLTQQNPFRVLPKAKKRDKIETKDVRFEPFTDKEMRVIFPWLKDNGYADRIAFYAMIFYAWARPIEIMRLRIKDIELDRDLISFKTGETKNSNAAYVQIVDPLKIIFEEMKLHTYPPDYYLFSDDYKPGVRMLNKSLPSKHWKLTIKNELGVKKDMYALKHTGNIEYLLKNKGNTNLKWQQMQNRHSSSVVTDRYNRKLGAYFIEVGDVNFRIL